MKRKIITIDDTKCNGCGNCIPGCPEGALQIIDGKARLVSDLFCDGLGACIGTCPQGAITIEEREAEAYDETKVMENIIPHGTNTIHAHLEHLRDHGEKDLLDTALRVLQKKGLPIPDAFRNESPIRLDKDTPPHHHGCPGAATREITRHRASNSPTLSSPSQLRNWPVQLALLNPRAPYLKGADLLISADCVPYAYASFHQRFLQDKILITFCPKLDKSVEAYINKLADIFQHQKIESLTILHMEVPCCSGTLALAEQALRRAGITMPIREYTISISGDIL